MADTGNAYLIPKRFAMQSYFDDTFLEKALLEQPPGQQIVPSTMDTVEISGDAIGLHPDSEAPIAVRFRFDQQERKVTSGALILTPGMVVTPREGSFAAIQWGLPFGWLGGGVATLQVFQGTQGYSAGRAREVIFHTQRMQIAADANPPPAIVKNLPIGFPWKNARRAIATNLLGIDQSNEQAIGVVPTRMLMRLRLNLAATADMRMIFRGLQGFDDAPDGISWGTTDLTYQDTTWPLNPGTSLPFPVIEIVNPAAGYGGPDAGLTLLDITGTLVEAYVDVVRYGLI